MGMSREWRKSDGKLGGLEGEHKNRLNWIDLKGFILDIGLREAKQPAQARNCEGW